MIRKLVIAAAAVAALSAGALTLSATSADAKGWGKWHHHHHRGLFWRGFRFYGPGFPYYDGCLRRVWAATPFGLKRRLVNVCY
jgi:hypothetical protein